jgi:hypothetical protein
VTADARVDLWVIADPVRTEQMIVTGHVDDPAIPAVRNPVNPAAPEFQPKRLTVTYVRRVEDDGALVGPWRIHSIHATDLGGHHATWAPSIHTPPGWVERFAVRCMPDDPAHVYTDPEE